MSRSRTSFSFSPMRNRAGVSLLLRFQTERTSSLSRVDKTHPTTSGISKASPMHARRRFSHMQLM